MDTFISIIQEGYFPNMNVVLCGALAVVLSVIFDDASVFSLLFICCF